MTDTVFDLTADPYWPYLLMSALHAEQEGVIFQGNSVVNAIRAENGTPILQCDPLDVVFTKLDSTHFTKIFDSIALKMKHYYGLHVSFAPKTTRIKRGSGSTSVFVKIKRVEDGRYLFSMNIRVGDNEGYTSDSGASCMYQNGNFSFRGDSPLRVLSKSLFDLVADKKPVGGLVSVYKLSLSSGWSLDDIRFDLRHVLGAYGNKRAQNNFDKAWKRLRLNGYTWNTDYAEFEGIKDKPDSTVLIGRVRNFVYPFLTGDYKEINAVWVNGRWVNPVGGRG